MKLKALAALCKKEATYRILDRETEHDINKPVLQQWLGVNGAIYPLPDLPYLTENHIANLFDVSFGQIDSGKVKIESEEFPPELDGSDYHAGEVVLDTADGITIAYGAHVVRPYVTQSGHEFVNIEYLKPVEDAGVHLEIYERRSKSGQIYLAAKVGFKVVGLIMPIKFDEGFAVEMERLAVNARAALQEEKEREERRKKALGQMDLGEVTQAYIKQVAQRHGIEAGEVSE